MTRELRDAFTEIKIFGQQATTLLRNSQYMQNSSKDDRIGEK